MNVVEDKDPMVPLCKIQKSTQDPTAFLSKVKQTQK